jgi:hypothetical protein
VTSRPKSRKTKAKPVVKKTFVCNHRLFNSEDSYQSTWFDLPKSYLAAMSVPCGPRYAPKSAKKATVSRPMSQPKGKKVAAKTQKSGPKIFEITQHKMFDAEESYPIVWFDLPKSYLAAMSVPCGPRYAPKSAKKDSRPSSPSKGSKPQAKIGAKSPRQKNTSENPDMYPSVWFELPTNYVEASSPASSPHYSPVKKQQTFSAKSSLDQATATTGKGVPRPVSGKKSKVGK